MLFRWPGKAKTSPSTPLPRSEAPTPATAVPAPSAPSTDAKAEKPAPNKAKAPGASAFALEPSQLRRTVDHKSIGFKSTEDLVPATEALGQDRVREAIRFGLAMREPGYNVLVVGEPGVGRRALVRTLLAEHGAGGRRPDDWVYVTNFEALDRPKPLRLPAGRARSLALALTSAVAELQATLPAAFETEDYQARRRAVDEEHRAASEDAIDLLTLRAAEQNIAILRTPLGFALAPMHDGKVVKPEVFNQLPESMRREVETRISSFEAELSATLLAVPKASKTRRERLAELDCEVAKVAIEAALDAASIAFSDIAPVAEHFAGIERDLLADVPGLLRAIRDRTPARFSRYLANVLVANCDTRGAPVVEDMRATGASLTGFVEPALSGRAPDHLSVKAGALHRANGGVLLLEAGALIANPDAWIALKQALAAKQAAISPNPDVSALAPDPIDLDVKVVLLATREQVTRLEEQDAEVMRLFRIETELADWIPRTSEAEAEFARFAAGIVKAHATKPMDAEAVARLIEESARMAGDAELLSVARGRIADLVCEANHWVESDGRATLTRADVERAIEQRTERADRMRARAHDAFDRGLVALATDGTQVGQVNGLSSVEIGEIAFGQPMRITARVHAGQGRVTDIEREAALAGPLHTKGVMILWGFLAGRYATEAPLALGASLVIEQSYRSIDGDSAAAAELAALLSALAEAPARQELAVTGALDQWGAFAAVGGVNEKIEGFFDLCQSRGLTGTQGVLIPKANVRQLMLRPDVVDAVKDGWFTIEAVGTIDEAMQILTGLQAGERAAGGGYPAETLNGRVSARLAALASGGRR